MIAALFAVYTALSVAGLLLLREHLPHLRLLGSSGTDLSNLGPVIVGALMYVAGFVAWLAILARVPVSRAYPIAVGLVLAATTLCARWILGERLSAMQYAGAAVVFIGIAMLARADGV